MVSVIDSAVAAHSYATVLPGQAGTGLSHAAPAFSFSPVSEAQMPASFRRAGPQVRIPGHWAKVVVFLHCRLSED